MSVRPHDNGRPPAPPALDAWPKDPPFPLTADERRCWERLGAAVLGLKTVSAADLPMAARAAQVSARVDAALADPLFKPTALNALLKLEVEMWRLFGLTPQSRRGVAPLPQGDDGSDDPLKEFA